MDAGVIVPVALFLAIFGMLAVIMYYRHRGRQEIQLTIRAAIDSGQTLSPELLEEMRAALNPQRNDLRRGVILLSIGAAIAVLALIEGDPEIFGVVAFPVFVAIAYLGLWVTQRNDT